MMNQEEYTRDKNLYLYLCGLERGDFEQMQRILRIAETDTELAELIEEAHKQEAEEAGLIVTAEDIARAQATVRATFAGWKRSQS